jgi:thiol-disulfide isomerase/thioredoxin
MKISVSLVALVLVAAACGSSLRATDPVPPAPADVAGPTLANAPPILSETNLGLVDLDGWLQSEVTSLEELRGKVVVVDFWTFGCINCKRTIPHLQTLYETYQDQGLEIVGVHAPEFAYEAEVDNIKQALIDLGVVWPQALDTNKKNFRAWQDGRAFWPRKFVLDKQGRIRWDHIGEGAYDDLTATVAYLLEEEG